MNLSRLLGGFFKGRRRFGGRRARRGGLFGRSSGRMALGGLAAYAARRFLGRRR